MRTHRFRVGEEDVEVTLAARSGGHWTARVVRKSGESTRVETIDVAATSPAEGRWLAAVDAGGVLHRHDVRVEREAGGGSGRRVRFGWDHVELERVDPFAPSEVGRTAGGAGPRRIGSPMPGRVVSVLVQVGDVVTQGQSVVVVEAMKMANELRAPVAGRVTSVTAKSGDKVDAGTPLVVVQPER